jgi:hypothetical protein
MLAGGFQRYGTSVLGQSLRRVAGAAPLGFLVDLGAQLVTTGQMDVGGAAARSIGGALVSYALTAALVAAGVSGGLPLMAALIGGGIAGAYLGDWLLARHRASNSSRDRSHPGRVSLLGL